MQTKEKHTLLKSGKLYVRKKITPWCILFLPIVFTIWLKYYPIFSAFYISLFKYDPINPPGRFVGFANYTGMFNMQFYWDSWKNTFIFLMLQLGMCFFIPLIQALLLNELRRMQKCLTTLYILPALIPTSVNVIIWKWIWHPDYGVANQIVKFFGGQPQAWLSDPNLVKFCIIFPGVLGGGLTVLLYLSAIQGVSPDIMESASLDGCTGFKRIFHIILPEHIIYDFYSAYYERYHNDAASGCSVHVCIGRPKRCINDTGNFYLQCVQRRSQLRAGISGLRCFAYCDCGAYDAGDAF